MEPSEFCLQACFGLSEVVGDLCMQNSEKSSMRFQKYGVTRSFSLFFFFFWKVNFVGYMPVCTKWYEIPVNGESLQATQILTSVRSYPVPLQTTLHNSLFGRRLKQEWLV